jgi:L-seryl-tRNA(Ser) seleniumtransferase
MKKVQEQLRRLPSVDKVLGRKEVDALVRKEGRKAVTDAIRSLILKRRRAIMESGGRKEGEPGEITEAEILSELGALETPSIVKVINATGVVIHTNLGRSPLPSSSLDYLKEVAGGYCNIEYDIREGRRGSRYDHIEALLCEMTGAEASHVVNNNAAALLLAATALARGREIVISRGELIEIGDSFRLPDVIEQSGARLVEVGPTNRTRPADYEKVLTDRTGMIIKAHQSNFYMEGFVEETPIEALVAMGRARAVPVLYDIGSGALELPRPLGARTEPSIRKAVESGADVVTCSGDKLLGGPQAGIILGRKETVTFLRRHAMTRALRPCKLTLTLLAHVLLLYRQGRFDRIPAYAMIARTPGELRRDAGRLAARLGKILDPGSWTIEVAREESKVGGGALPREVLESWVVTLRHERLSAGQIEEKLRLGRTPIVCRVHGGALVIDVRTLAGGEAKLVAGALASLEP